MWKVLGWRCNFASARRHPAARPISPAPRVVHAPWPAGVDASGRAVSTRVAQRMREIWRGEGRYSGQGSTVTSCSTLSTTYMKTAAGPMPVWPPLATAEIS